MKSNNLFQKHQRLLFDRAKIIFLISSFLIHCGCMTNSYKDFYSSYDQPPEKWQKGKKEVQIIEIEDLSEVVKWESRGYCILGHSKFNGRWCSRALAINCAKKNGASIILAYFRNTKMEYTEQKIVVPVAETTYHQGTINTFSGGFANFSGTSTTHGVTPMTIGYIDAKWDQEAIFLAPLKRIPDFGIDFERSPHIPGNKEEFIKVRVVYHGTPAEKQGIRPGDIIKKINGREINSIKEINYFLSNKSKIFSLEVRHVN